jgi:hypothetical protein
MLIEPTRNIQHFGDVAAADIVRFFGDADVPIATRRFSAARPNPLTSPANVISDFFSAYHFRPTRLFEWRERTLQSSISSVSFSAPAHLLGDVQILPVRPFSAGPVVA